jgi:hypothetical protein
MQGLYRNHMEEVIKFFETHHKVITTCIFLKLIITGHVNAFRILSLK